MSCVAKGFQSDVPQYIKMHLVDNLIAKMNDSLYHEAISVEDRRALLEENIEISKQRKLIENNLEMLREALESIEDIFQDIKFDEFNSEYDDLRSEL